MKKSIIQIIGIILTLSLALSSTLAFSGCSSGGSENATADSSPADNEVREITSPALVKTVTEYSRNYETQEWEKVRVSDYTYENGYPTVVTLVEDDGADQSKTEYEYTFDGDLQ